jgi:nucleotide-binding universal stress UspA family protein
VGYYVSDAPAITDAPGVDYKILCRGGDMFEKLIVPLDCSKLAEAALPYAEELGAKMGSEIVLLSVIGSGDHEKLANYLSYIKKIQGATNHYAGKYIENDEEQSYGVTTVRRTGDPAGKIIEYAMEIDFPLIVMASHGQTGMSRWAVGSVADKVVRAGKTQAVMLIRGNGSRADIRDKRLLKRVLVPLDGSFKSETVIPYICNIAMKLQMEMTFLQVISQNGNSEADTKLYLDSVCRKIQDMVDVHIDYRVCVGSVAETIIDLADELTVDLVAMSTRGMNRNNPLSLGSVAQKVFLAGNTPLLLIRK